MTIISDARAILAVLQPMTGTRSTGNLTVNADAGPPVLLPRNSYGVPVVKGSIRYDLLLKTAANPAADTGWTVSAGSTVGVVSNVGGVPQNAPEGTVVRWWPALDGVELQSVVGPGGLTGGAAQTGLTAVHELAFFDELQAQNPTAQMLHSMVSRFPAIVVAWERSGELKQMGRDRWVEKQIWGLYVVTSRLDADPSRRLEGVAILDEACDTVWGRQSVDGMHFSTPTGIQITQRQRVATKPEFYIYRAQLETWAEEKRREHRTYSPWIRTKLDMETMDADPFPVVVNNKFPMPQ